MTALISRIKPRTPAVNERGANDRGASAVEYALIVGLIAVAIVVGVTAFGTSLGTFFSGLFADLGI